MAEKIARIPRKRKVRIFKNSFLKETIINVTVKTNEMNAAILIPNFICIRDISPDCNILSGPILFLSVPRIPSPKSFAKFERTWYEIVVQIASKKIKILNRSFGYVANEPIKIPETDKGIVLNLAAFIQGLIFLNIFNVMLNEQLWKLWVFFKVWVSFF